MPYKTVLVHIDESNRTAERVRLAATIARDAGGHLIGAALTGVSRSVYDDDAPHQPDAHLALHLNMLREQARQALTGFGAQVAALGLASFEQRVLDDEAGGGISLLARYADLVVIGQIDPDHASASVMDDFPAYVVLNSGRPVLIVPYAGAPQSGAPAPGHGMADTARHGVARNVLISWNASKEAGRAVNAALPLLQQAEQVHVAIFDPDQDSAAHAGQPGAELLSYLARHGINAQLSLRHSERHAGLLKWPSGVGEALLSHAADVAADLLVMGAYGHSRLRETLLGGVTRTVLQTMTLPVLMAH